MIPIGGVVPFSSIDFPGKLAAVLFCQGCPLRCRYCHNPHLQKLSSESIVPWSEFRDFLISRRGLLDAVVFSGGEPLIHKKLYQAMKECKNLGYQIGLHTAGTCSNRIKEVLPLIDWVGMDIKAPFAKYERVTQRKNSHIQAKKSAQMILQSGVDYEFRTTVHKTILSEEDLLTIGSELNQLGADSFSLQSFRADGCIDKELNRDEKSFFSNALRETLGGQFSKFAVR